MLLPEATSTRTRLVATTEAREALDGECLSFLDELTAWEEARMLLDRRESAARIAATEGVRAISSSPRSRARSRSRSAGAAGAGGAGTDTVRLLSGAAIGADFSISGVGSAGIEGSGRLTIRST